MSFQVYNFVPSISAVTGISPGKSDIFHSQTLLEISIMSDKNWDHLFDSMRVHEIKWPKGSEKFFLSRVAWFWKLPSFSVRRWYQQKAFCWNKIVNAQGQQIFLAKILYFTFISPIILRLLLRHGNIYCTLNQNWYSKLTQINKLQMCCNKVWCTWPHNLRVQFAADLVSLWIRVMCVQ